MIETHNPWERELTDDERKAFRRAAYHIRNLVSIHVDDRSWMDAAVDGLVALSLLGDGQTVFGYESPDHDGTEVYAGRDGRVHMRVDDLGEVLQGCTPNGARELAAALTRAADAVERQRGCSLTQEFFRKIEKEAGP